VEICKQQSEIEIRHLPAVERFKRYWRKSGRGNFFLDQSIGIDKTKTFQLKFLSSMKIVGTTGLGGLWALEWALQIFGSIDRY